VHDSIVVIWVRYALETQVSIEVLQVKLSTNADAMSRVLSFGTSDTLYQQLTTEACASIVRSR
jgi:hypothetical protein